MLNRQVKEGRNLLAEQQGSLAAEMGTMTDEQVGKNYKEFQANYTDNRCHSCQLISKTLLGTSGMRYIPFLFTPSHS